MILEEIIRSLREKKEKLERELYHSEPFIMDNEVAYIKGRIREIEDLITQLENIA